MDDTIGLECSPCYAYVVPAMFEFLKFIVFAGFFALTASVCRRAYTVLVDFQREQNRNEGMVVDALLTIRNAIEHLPVGNENYEDIGDLVVVNK